MHASVVHIFEQTIINNRFLI